MDITDWLLPTLKVRLQIHVPPESLSEVENYLEECASRLPLVNEDYNISCYWKILYKKTWSITIVLTPHTLALNLAIVTFAPPPLMKILNETLTCITKLLLEGKLRLVYRTSRSKWLHVTILIVGNIHAVLISTFSWLIWQSRNYIMYMYIHKTISIQEHIPCMCYNLHSNECCIEYACSSWQPLPIYLCTYMYTTPDMCMSREHRPAYSGRGW